MTEFLINTSQYEKLNFHNVISKILRKCLKYSFTSYNPKLHNKTLLLPPHHKPLSICLPSKSKSGFPDFCAKSIVFVISPSIRSKVVFFLKSNFSKYSLIFIKIKKMNFKVYEKIFQISSFHQIPQILQIYH